MLSGRKDKKELLETLRKKKDSHGEQSVCIDLMLDLEHKETECRALIHDIAHWPG